MTGALGNTVVTGATGFIGRELCHQLLAAGHTLTGISRSAPPAGQFPAETPGLKMVTGDILDREFLTAVMAGAETVFHLAGIAHVDKADPARLLAVNAEGTQAVAEVAAEVGVHTMVLFSSSLAQAAEQQAPHATAYGGSKLRGEAGLLRVARGSSLSPVILRPVNVYGPGMKGNIAAMIGLIRRRLLPPLPKLDTRVSLIGVEDLCRAAVLAATSEAARGKSYYVTDGEIYSLNAIESAIYRAMDRKPPRWHSPRAVFYLGALAMELWGRVSGRPGGFGLRTYHNLLADSRYSNQQISTELGFVPRQTFYTALPELDGLK